MNNDAFNMLSVALGSPYAATMYVSKMARKKMRSKNNQVLESEAISWVLTGEQPKERKRIQLRYDKYDVVDEVLQLIDNKAVVKSVRRSYGESLKRHHLIYCYHRTLATQDRVRVRILTRMIWYNIIQEGGYIYEQSDC